MARDERMVIRLSSNMKQAVNEEADRLGLTTSALVAYIVGQWVDQKRRIVGPMSDEVARLLALTLQGQNPKPSE